MADKSDVEAALVTLAAGALYPSGPGEACVAGVPVRVYRGWPNAEQLDPDVQAGTAHVTVFEAAGFTRLGAGGLDHAMSVRASPATLAARVAGPVVTFSGTAAASQLAGVAFGGQSWVYAVQASDTPLSVAQALAALIAGAAWTLESGTPITDDSGNPLLLSEGATASASGADGVLTIATTLPITARVVAAGQTICRVRQQVQGFRIVTWAPSPAARDAVCATVDAVFADARWVQLPDQRGRLIYRNTITNDVPSRARLWRRDLLYTVQFWTTITTAVPEMLFGDTEITVADATVSVIS